ncbi:hypothetical protein ABZU32_17500 [Sphaerisporangium sp. NPDC005288]|uniref:hypothetical protein n=1 Tax=Sphaerisporangium sp. NPDC005288 TaxID=3155114 RepID=UPI00339E5E39
MSTPQILADLQSAFPGWCIWRSSDQRVWATRNGRHLSADEIEQGLCETLSADDVSQLAEQLRTQEGLEL